MVTTKDCDSVGESHFECDEESDSLDRVVATIDVVTHEEVVCVGRLSTNFEKLAQIVELSVDIATNRHWCTYLLNVGLIYQNFFRLNSSI